MKRKTETEKLNERAAKHLQRQRECDKETALLHERVRRGELTAGQALQIRCKKKGAK